MRDAKREILNLLARASPPTQTILELGAHDGSDTRWMARLPGVTVHAFEPDPRNVPPELPNVRLVRAAISDRDGRAPFFPSRDCAGRPWTASGSLLRPTGHMARYPTVTFDEEPIEVATVTLDTYTRPLPGLIDFIWADVQGAEHLLIAGGRETLARTRHFFTEYSDVELYQGQRSLEALLALLPGWEITSRWEDDALLTNRRLG